MDTDFLDREPEPWEFRSKSIGARMLVLSAGVIMNVLLALVIFSSIQYIRGKYTEVTTEIGYVTAGSAAEKAGMMAGDKIISINGQIVTHWDEIQSLIYIENLGNDISLEVNRGGKNVPIFIPSKELSSPSENQLGLMVAFTVPTIDGVESHMPAEQLGLKSGDVIVSVNNIPLSYPQIVAVIKKNAGKNVTISWKRGDQLLSGSTIVTAEGRIGIKIGARYVGPSKHIQFSLLESAREGLGEVAQSLRLFVLTLSKIFSGKASVKESFGGPIAIAQFATQSAEYGVMAFLWFMANLSMSLAILNILPIPALDGGHLIMLFYEKVFRREIPRKVKLGIQQAGFILLLAFMAFVIYNDFSKF